MTNLTLHFTNLLVIGTVLTLSGCDSMSPQKQLEKWVVERKESTRLPQKIDDNISLIDIRSGQLELIQVFEIKGFAGELPADKQAELRDNVVKELIKKKDQIQNLIDFKIVMTFKYQNPKKTVLHEFQIKPWEDQ